MPELMQEKAEGKCSRNEGKATTIGGLNYCWTALWAINDIQMETQGFPVLYNAVVVPCLYFVVHSCPSRQAVGF